MAYHDFEVQHFEANARVGDPQTQSGTSNPEQTRNEAGAAFEVVSGDLHRSEVAELVALYVQNHIVHVDQPSLNTPTNVRAAATIGLDVPETMLTDDDVVSVDYQGLLTGGDVFTGPNDNTSDWRDEDAPDVWWQNQLIAVPSWYNSTTGAGAPGTLTGNPGPQLIPFREWFGRGPIVDPPDEVRTSWAWNLTNYAADNNLYQQVRGTLYWQVHDRDAIDF